MNQLETTFFIIKKDNIGCFLEMENIILENFKEVEIFGIECYIAFEASLALKNGEKDCLLSNKDDRIKFLRWFNEVFNEFPNAVFKHTFPFKEPKMCQDSMPRWPAW